MKRFDFKTYYARIGKAVSDEEIAVIRMEHDAFQESLTESERALFRADFDQYLTWSLDRAEIEIAFLKEMLAEAQVV